MNEPVSSEDEEIVIPAVSPTGPSLPSEEPLEGGIVLPFPDPSLPKIPRFEE